ncbi:hypothetical protein [Microcoleus sp. S13_B4]
MRNLRLIEERKKEEGRRKAQSSAHVSAIKNVIIVGRGWYRR